MCEPCHSISQFSQPDGLTAQSPVSVIETTPGFIKINEYLHISAFGMGHSESQRHKVRNVQLPHTKYETDWWDRTTRFDSRFHGPDFDKDHALESADIYAHRTVTGSLDKLRRFLEVSIEKSERPAYYIESARQMLNQRGKDEFDKRLKMILGTTNVWESKYDRVTVRAKLTNLVKMICGLTRKREFLNDAWSEDKLWVPKKQELILP